MSTIGDEDYRMVLPLPLRAFKRQSTLRNFQKFLDFWKFCPGLCHFWNFSLSKSQNTFVNELC